MTREQAREGVRRNRYYALLIMLGTFLVCSGLQFVMTRPIVIQDCEGPDE